MNVQIIWAQAWSTLAVNRPKVHALESTAQTVSR